jgi:NarL family two-component system response regulator LiaR
VGAQTDPIRVGILTTQEVVAVGLRTILENAPTVHIISHVPAGVEPDVVLYDLIKLVVEDGRDLEYWLTESSSTVIAIDRTLRPELGIRAREKGVEWSVTLGITAAELVTVISDAVTGQLDDSPVAQEWEAGDYPGKDTGLTRRESEILGLIVQGRSNQQTADHLFLSINSVKSYIRSTYRKIGVSTRSQAVAWGIRHGFPIEPAAAPMGPPTAVDS